MCTLWNNGDRRLNAALICCPCCGSVDVFRRGSKEGTAHWRCRTCAQHWTEDLAVGRGKACNAKTATALVVWDWQPGQRRLEAEIVCCPNCSCTRVRRSNARTLIAYWYCGHCGRGWNELAEVARTRDCRVKLPEAFAGQQPAAVPPLSLPLPAGPEVRRAVPAA